MKFVNHNSAEKAIIKDAFNSLSYMDLWICSIIEGYIYENVDSSFRNFKEEYILRYDKKEGEYKEWYSGQLRKHCYYKEGEREGEYKQWWWNGQLFCQEYYKDGEREGEYKQWHIDGQLEYQCYYKEGKLEGEYTKWYEGELIQYKLYENGEVVKDLLMSN